MTSTSDNMEEINKRLKDMARDIENSRRTPNEDDHDVDSEPLLARYKSILEHSGASSSNQITLSR